MGPNVTEEGAPERVLEMCGGTLLRLWLLFCAGEGGCDLRLKEEPLGRSRQNHPGSLPGAGIVCIPSVQNGKKS